MTQNSNTLLAINNVDSTSISGSGIFDIYDKNMNPILETLYTKDHTVLGPTPYRVNILTDGYYYIKVSSSYSIGNYLFTIGGPNYYS